MDPVLSVIYEIVDSDAARYVSATAVGFVLAVVAGRLNTRRIETRQVRILRHALADELAHNLHSFWRLNKSFSRALSTNVTTWPNATVATFALDQAVQPTVGSLLSEREQTFAHILRRDLDTMLEEMELIKAARRDNNPSRIFSGYRSMIDNYLPVNGVQAIRLLSFVLQRQGSFPSSDTQSMAEDLLPALEGGARTPTYLWLTSQIPLATYEAEPGTLLIVWENDQPELVPSGVRVVALAARFRSENYVIETNQLATRARKRFQRWRQRREVGRGIERHKQYKKD